MMTRLKTFLSWFFSSWQILVAFVLIAVSVNVLIYYLGRAHERASHTQMETAQAIADLRKAFDDEVKRVDAVIARAQAASEAAEAARSKTDDFYNQLEDDARHDPIITVDRCVLPAERLRRWHAANAGPTATDTSAPASQPERGTGKTATTKERRNARSGSQSP